MSNDIVLGWRINSGSDPRYWVRPQAKVGGHDQSDLVKAPAESIAFHTVIVAQSGSGKSFFLGRFLEEILIKTRSRVVVFDPNSDFKKAGDVVGAQAWIDAAYNADKRRGFLPDETDRATFKMSWDAVDKVVYSLNPLDKPYHAELKIDWPLTPADIISGEIDSNLRTEFKHCHDFVKTISQLMLLVTPDEKSEANFLDLAKSLAALTRGKDEAEILLHIKDKFPSHKTGTQSQIDLKFFKVIFDTEMLPALSANDRKRQVEELHELAAMHRGFVSEPTERFYFSSAYAVQETGLIREGRNEKSKLTEARLQVMDLPSIGDRRFRDLAVSALIDLEWTRARQSWQEALKSDPSKDLRVPTFIVVDEAHNLIPAEPRGHAEFWLREQFRTLAAEGRKYGLYLILVSQRPDKLDPLVISECENRGVMKLGAEAVLKKTIEILGLNDVPIRTAQRCLEFDVGRALIVGPWAPEGPTSFYAAARRTEEGGRNLRSEFWSVLPAVPEPPKNSEGDITPKK